MDKNSINLKVKKVNSYFIEPNKRVFRVEYNKSVFRALHLNSSLLNRAIKINSSNVVIIAHNKYIIFLTFYENNTI